MKNFNFTILGKDIQPGMVLSAAVNKSSESDVDMYFGTTMVGSIASEPTSMLNGYMCNALQARKLLDNPKCKEFYALVRKVEKRGNQLLCGAEAYFVPSRTESAPPEVRSYKVGGPASQYTAKTAFLGELVALKNEGKPIEVPVVIFNSSLGGEEKIMVGRSNDTNPTAAVGNIMDADEELKTLMSFCQIVSGKVTKTGARQTCTIEVSMKQVSTEDYYPAIDAAIARCAGQSKDLEARVQHMVANRFEGETIKAVLAQMPAGLSGNIPNPTQKYYQSVGSNLQDLVSYMLFGMTVRLVGEKGSGKNTLAETACWLLNRPLCRVQGSIELDKMDLLGSRTLTNGNTGFELSAMLETLRDDGVVVIDEANMVRPEVLGVMHSLTDGARAIDVPGYGYVKIGPHACILYTLNENYVGTGEMNAATVDRGPTLVVEQEANMVAMLKNAVPDASDENIKICCKVSDEVRRAVKNGDNCLSEDAITVRGYIAALKAAAFIPIKRALIHNVANKAQVESERLALSEIISANIG